MALVVLIQAYEGKLPGDVIEVTGGVASALVMRKIGSLCPEDRRVEIQSPRRVASAIAQFESAIAEEDLEACSEQLFEFAERLVLKLPAEQLSVEQKLANLTNATFEELAREIDEVRADTSVDADKLAELQDSIDAFAAVYATKPVGETEAESAGTEETPAATPLDRMNSQELAALAQSLGIVIPEGHVTNKALRELIKTRQAH